MSSQEDARSVDENGVERNKSTMGRSKSRNDHAEEPADDFDIGTMPLHERNKVYKARPMSTSKVAKFLKKIHNSSFLVRYFVYITPFTVLLLIPVLFGLLLFPSASVGGVRLFWFGIWLEIVWLTLWAARVSTRTLHALLNWTPRDSFCIFLARYCDRNDYAIHFRVTAVIVERLLSLSCY